MIKDNSQAIGQKEFTFSCHSQVGCFKSCCARLELYLYPYDVLRLKNKLHISSGEFMKRYTRLAAGSHPYFPAVMLMMNDDVDNSCPFLSTTGCTVYQDRPSACRTYPLERAVECAGTGQSIQSHYFMTNHPYCQGHRESKTYTIRKWEVEQQLYDYNHMNDLWAEVDVMFSRNPWQGEGHAGPLQQLAFMACYNIDEYRTYCDQHHLIQGYQLTRDQKRRIKKDDGELLRFAFAWLLHILNNKPILRSC